MYIYFNIDLSLYTIQGFGLSLCVFTSNIDLSLERIQGFGLSLCIFTSNIDLSLYRIQGAWTMYIHFNIDLSLERIQGVWPMYIHSKQINILLQDIVKFKRNSIHSLINYMIVIMQII